MEPTVELIRQCIMGLYQAVVALFVLFLMNVVLCLVLSVKLARMSRVLKSLTPRSSNAL